jgi:MGT family glycosyltransferase
MAKKEHLGEIPDNIAIFEYVDQIAVLKSADIFISHCGMNSVSESLYFGVPLMMVPQTSEQGGVAARTEMLGAGIILKDTGADAIRQAADRLASEESFRNNAKAIGDSFRKCSGPAGAAEKILSLCTSHEKN